FRYGARADELTRREMLRAAAAAGVGLLLSGSGLASVARRGERRRVLVIGAGLAGLSCAYELNEAGYDVTVVEARDRIGGRVLSFNADCGTEFIRGRNVEGGG